MKLSKKKLNRIRNTKNQSKRKYKKMKRKKIRSRQRRLNLKKRTLKKTVMSGGAWLDKLKSFFSKKPLENREEEKKNALKALDDAHREISNLINTQQEAETKKKGDLKNLRKKLKTYADSGSEKTFPGQIALENRIKKVENKIKSDFRKRRVISQLSDMINNTTDDYTIIQARIKAQEAIADMQQLQLDLLRKQKKETTFVENVKVKVRDKIQKIKEQVLKLQDKPCDEECKEKKENSSISYQIVTSFLERDNDGNIVLDKKTKKPKILAPGYLMQYVILNSGMSAATAITTASRAMAVKTNKSSDDKQNVLTTTLVPSAIETSKTVGPVKKTDTSDATSPFKEMDTSTRVLPINSFKKIGPVKPTNPTKPINPTKPMHTSTTVLPIKPTKPLNPMNPIKPMKKKTQNAPKFIQTTDATKKGNKSGKKGNKSRKKLKKGKFKKKKVPINQ